MKYLLLFSLVFSQNLFAANDGRFVVVKGNVFIESHDGSTKTKARPDSIVNASETVIAEANSNAKIVMKDRNVINILPNTRLKITKYSNTIIDKGISLKLMEGRLRTSIDKDNKYNESSNKFEVHTTTAIAGVRGTDFITTFDSKTNVTEIITFEGQVNFINNEAESSSEQKLISVIVKAGEKSQIKSKQPPSEPIKVPASELAQLNSETAVLDQTSEGNSSGNTGAGVSTTTQTGSTTNTKTNDPTVNSKAPLIPSKLPPLEAPKIDKSKYKK